MTPATAHLIADEITGAPDNGWTALGAATGVIGAAIVYGIVKLIMAWRAPTPRTEEIAGQRYDVTGLTQQMITLLSDAITEARTAREENEAHEERIGVLEQTQGGLAAHIILLRNGIQDGTIPPLPPTPEEIAHLLQIAPVPPPAAD